jgi:hypothetical protein
MKKQTLLAITMVTIGSLFFASCEKEQPPTDNTPKNELVELTGDLKSQKLTKDKKYLIKSQTFIRKDVVVEVEPGTVIYGEKRTRGTLIVDRGGKLIARGTANEPIVFTSNQEVGDRDRGDWGGLVILGNAACNQVDPGVEGITPAVYFGGNSANVESSNVINNNDNSGEFIYVRVEFAGIELTPNNETNSITMGGVGAGTKMEYCQVSFGGDDGFEWFGGNVDGKYFISFNSWDDCYDVDFGYSGKVQFGLAVRYPSYADQSGSNSFECDNGPNDNDVMPYTTGTFSNFTCVGPIKSGTSVSNGNFQHSIDLRRRTAVTIANSVFTGFPRGVRMNQASVLSNYNTNVGHLSNNVLVGTANATIYQAGSGVDVNAVKTYWEANNQTISGPNSDSLTKVLGLNPSIFYASGKLASEYTGAANFPVTSGILTSGAAFTKGTLTNAHFDKVSFRGAFGATNWTSGWAEFDPKNKAY